jgi:Methyltransferase domain
MKDAMEILKRLSSAAKEGRLVSGVLRTLARKLFRRWIERPHISVRGDFSALPESVLVKQSFDRALANIGGPPDFVRAIDGMSGQKYRTFINNLVGSHPDARYLEIGSWQGSTAAAALYGNSVKALCIDNWSQFGGPKSAFLANIERVQSQSPAVEFRLIEKDFRRVDYTSLGRFNIFLFDGPHEEMDQYDGIMVARPALEKSFVLIVDDWNWQQVRLGTFRAIRDARYSIAFSIEIRTTQDNSYPEFYTGKGSDWHNGYFIAVLVGV